jgi:hypothetical protein
LPQLSVQLHPQVQGTYDTGRIEAQAQSARPLVNKPLIGRKLLNDANSAHSGHECCGSGNYLFEVGNIRPPEPGFSGL